MEYENNLTKNYVPLMFFSHKNYSQCDGKICIINTVSAQKGL